MVRSSSEILAKVASVAPHYTKMQLARFLVIGATARAFAPAPRAPTPVRLHGAYEDAVAEAKSFSVGSPEARAAWAAVEEIEGADNSAATKPSLADECDALNPSKECREYANSMAELEAILASSKAKSDSIKVQVSKFAQTPLPSSSSSSPAETPGAAAAVAAAEKASSEFGPTSSEAKAAWAVVEEINDSLDAPAAALPGLDQDCVVAALEKCREFDAAMASLEKSLAAMK
mmetsp:Transcript_27532/g.71276  ORF Transcript_27532/g.71276 Transcript_27532/m.71276 type:complete len:232 (-) Transcript_27532:60-755(-)